MRAIAKHQHYHPALSNPRVYMPERSSDLQPRTESCTPDTTRSVTRYTQVPPKVSHHKSPTATIIIRRISLAAYKKTPSNDGTSGKNASTQKRRTKLKLAFLLFREFCISSYAMNFHHLQGTRHCSHRNGGRGRRDPLETVLAGRSTDKSTNMRRILASDVDAYS